MSAEQRSDADALLEWVREVREKHPPCCPAVDDRVDAPSRLASALEDAVKALRSTAGKGWQLTREEAQAALASMASRRIK